MVAVASCTAGAGTTVTAAALTATWPQARPVLVECDPGGGDLAAWAGLEHGPGLVSLAASARGGRAVTVTDHVQRVGDLAVVAAPVTGTQAHAAVAVLTRHGSAPFRGGPGEVIVVDCGRVPQIGSPQWGLVRQADALIVVLRPVLVDMLRFADLMPGLREELCGTRTRCGVVVSACGQDRYPAQDVVQAIGVPVLAEWPIDQAGARIVTGRAPARNSDRCALIRAAGACTRRLARDLEQADPAMSSPAAAAQNTPGQDRTIADYKETEP